MKDNITNYSELFRPLEKVTGGRKSGERIVWNDSLRAAFESVQKATKSPDILALAKTGLTRISLVVAPCMLSVKENGRR